MSLGINMLLAEHLFGMRACVRCPDCNYTDDTSEGNCMDLFGSNAHSEGGIFGRADGMFVSVEAQKSAGALHAHGQLHVQCIHQHRPLAEILTILAGSKAYLVQEYLQYKHHVCRQWYEDLQGWRERQQQREEDWPEYKKSKELVSKPTYILQDKDPESWRNEYLSKHVQRIQEMKQNHVHTLNAKGERVPLLHCRRSDDSKKCKAEFPRTLWIIDKAVVLCHGLLKKWAWRPPDVEIE